MEFQVFETCYDLTPGQSHSVYLDSYREIDTFKWIERPVISVPAGWSIFRASVTGQSLTRTILGFCSGLFQNTSCCLTGFWIA
jgi:hypothetical protein